MCEVGGVDELGEVCEVGEVGGVGEGKETARGYADASLAKRPCTHTQGNMESPQAVSRPHSAKRQGVRIWNEAVKALALSESQTLSRLEAPLSYLMYPSYVVSMRHRPLPMPRNQRTSYTHSNHNDSASTCWCQEGI